MGRVSAGDSLGGPEKIASHPEPESPQRAMEVPDGPGGGLWESPERIHWKGENQASVMRSLKQLTVLPVTLKLLGPGARKPHQGGTGSSGEKGVAKFRENAMGFRIY